VGLHGCETWCLTPRENIDWDVWEQGAEEIIWTSAYKRDIYFGIIGFSQLFPSSRVLNNWKPQRFGKWICFRPHLRGERHLPFEVHQKKN
jgi:hypothetical protein